MTPGERAVLAYADCLALQAGRTPEPVFAALKAFLSDEEILELTYITCLYDMHAVMTKALRPGMGRPRRPYRRGRRAGGFQRPGLPGHRPATLDPALAPSEPLPLFLVIPGTRLGMTS